MDSYKRKIIKAGEIVETGKSVPLSGHVAKNQATDAGPGRPSATSAQDKGQTIAAESSSQITESQIRKIGQDAYAKGYAEGIKSQNKELLSAIEALATATKSLPLIKKHMMEKGEEQMVKLAFAIAEKIIQQEVATRKDVIMGVLKGAIKNVADTEGMKIRLNTQDFRYMMEVKKDFLQSFDGIRNVVFEEDSSIKRGGAVVETMFGDVDARLENQIKEIRAALLHAK